MFILFLVSLVWIFSCRYCFIETRGVYYVHSPIIIPPALFSMIIKLPCFRDIFGPEMALEPMAVKQMFNFRPRARAHLIHSFTGAKRRGNIFPKY